MITNVTKVIENLQENEVIQTDYLNFKHDKLITTNVPFDRTVTKKQLYTRYNKDYIIRGLQATAEQRQEVEWLCSRDNVQTVKMNTDSTLTKAFYHLSDIEKYENNLNMYGSDYIVTNTDGSMYHIDIKNNYYNTRYNANDILKYGTIQDGQPTKLVFQLYAQNTQRGNTVLGWGTNQDYITDRLIYNIKGYDTYGNKLNVTYSIDYKGLRNFLNKLRIEQNEFIQSVRPNQENFNRSINKTDENGLTVISYRKYGYDDTGLKKTELCIAVPMELLTKNVNCKLIINKSETAISNL